MDSNASHINIRIAKNGVIVDSISPHTVYGMEPAHHVFNSKHDLFKYLEECGVLENTTK
jgi:hypothetical protein